MVLYGTAANPRFSNDPKASLGAGSTDFFISSVLKSAPALGEQKKIVLPRYIPIIDPKNPPKFIVFCSVREGQIYAYEGRTVKSPAILKYLQDAKSIQGKDRTTALLFYFRYLDHEDDVVSQDAFLEFARSSDREVGAVAKHLPADQLRRLLDNPKTPSERIGLLAFLLGVVGTDKDAAFLKSLIERPTERNKNALDGLLSGYVNLRGRAAGISWCRFWRITNAPTKSALPPLERCGFTRRGSRRKRKSTSCAVWPCSLPMANWPTWALKIYAKTNSGISPNSC